MLGEMKAPGRLRDAPDLAQNPNFIGHSAQRPSNDGTIGAVIHLRNRLGHPFDQFHMRAHAARGVRHHLQQFGGRIDADHAVDLVGVERKIDARTNADFENTSLRPQNRTLAIGCQLLLPRCHVD